VQCFHPEQQDKTLVVEKIPEDKLSLDTVNGWFKHFGTVTNVAVDASSSKALVSFSSNEEAHTAWKSEDAVFGNRFVKVFWHCPMEGQGLAGQPALAASPPIVASVTDGSQHRQGLRRTQHPPILHLLWLLDPARKRHLPSHRTRRRRSFCKGRNLGVALANFRWFPARDPTATILLQ
jgi:hypothetical protein